MEKPEIKVISILEGRYAVLKITKVGHDIRTQRLTQYDTRAEAQAFVDGFTMQRLETVADRAAREGEPLSSGRSEEDIANGIYRNGDTIEFKDIQYPAEEDIMNSSAKGLDPRKYESEPEEDWFDPVKHGEDLEKDWYGTELL